ncbi:protein prenyltransferase alpha subunit, putative [Plasmodium malariae]|nr:protein prenyltransferase alpha subunit, putative [Plasmodium malariae]
MIEEILSRFNKCNELWFHKLWVVKYCLKNNLTNIQDLLEELKYCKGSFYKDDRNYHCWNYRSYVIACIYISIRKNEREKVGGNNRVEQNESNNVIAQDCNNFNVHRLNYELSKELIEHNFSNFSAWFLKYSLKESFININDELNLIKNAIFTDPFDQSLWEFYRWFLFQKGNYKEEIFFILLQDNSIYFFFQNLVKVNVDKSKCYNLNSEEISGVWNKQLITMNNPLDNLESYVYIFKANEKFSLSHFTYLKFSLYYFKYNIYEHDKINYGKNILQDLLTGCDYSLKEENQFEYSIVYEINFQYFSKNEHFKLLQDYNNKNRKSCRFSSKKDCTNIYASLYEYINYSNILLSTARNMDFGLLQSELEQINELLYLESNCKFALFTKFEILKRLEKFDQMFQLLELLKNVDHIRVQYYNDWEVELRIQKKIYNYYQDSEIDDSNKVLDLSGLNIDRIDYPLMIEAFFIPKINLSNNLISVS